MSTAPSSAGERGVIVIGAGKRVLEAALPAFARCTGRFVVRRVYARTPRVLEAAGGPFRVQPLAELDAAALGEADLIYLCVPKDAIPSVLQALTRLDVSRHHLLIDTPVVRFKHFRHARKCAAFASATVPEDCAYLPWIELVRSAVGGVEEVVLAHSAYAYHGLATARALFGASHVTRGRRKRLGGKDAWREVIFAGGPRLEVLEPRRYDLGRVVARGPQGVAVSHAESEPHTLLVRVECEPNSGGVRALACGDQRVEFDEDETALTVGDGVDAGIIARQEAFKRVGFLRLLRAVHAGRGAYPLDDALEDMVVDYYLEKLGRYRATPFTNPRRGPARFALDCVTAFGR